MGPRHFFFFFLDFVSVFDIRIRGLAAPVESGTCRPPLASVMFSNLFLDSARVALASVPKAATMCQGFRGFGQLRPYSSTFFVRSGASCDFPLGSQSSWIEGLTPGSQTLTNVYRPTFFTEQSFHQGKSRTANGSRTVVRSTRRAVPATVPDSFAARLSVADRGNPIRVPGMNDRASARSVV
jgi:hypothetical protein